MQIELFCQMYSKYKRKYFLFLIFTIPAASRSLQPAHARQLRWKKDGRVR
jgi:hypothetical protein